MAVVNNKNRKLTGEQQTQAQLMQQGMTPSQLQAYNQQISSMQQSRVAQPQQQIGTAAQQMIGQGVQQITSTEPANKISINQAIANYEKSGEGQARQAEIAAANEKARKEAELQGLQNELKKLQAGIASKKAQKNGVAQATLDHIKEIEDRIAELQGIPRETAQEAAAAQAVKQQQAQQPEQQTATRTASTRTTLERPEMAERQEILRPEVAERQQIERPQAAERQVATRQDVGERPVIERQQGSERPQTTQAAAAPERSATGYNGLLGISEDTAQKVKQYQQGYQQSEAALAAQQLLEQTMAAKPQGYNNKYAPQLDSLLEQILNPDPFKYEFNGDNLFKYYSDLYTQQGKQASMDAMGQAAAMTGGYGNSWAETAGQQQYQQYLTQLYDKGLELRDRAYQQWLDEQNRKASNYSLLDAAEQKEYGRYRDTVGDWRSDLEYATNRADTERNFDYSQYKDNLDYWTGLAEIENRAYNTEAERQEAIRQYEQNFAYQAWMDEQNMLENRYQYDRNMAEQQWENDRALAEQQYQFDTNLYESQYQNDREMAERQYQYDRDLAESMYQNDRSMAENQYQFDANQAENRYQYDKDMLEKQWQYDTSMDENKYQYDTSFGENQRQFNESLAENKRQADMDNAYKYSALSEQAREADMDNAYKNSALAEDARQADQANQYKYDALQQSQYEFEQGNALDWQKLQMDQAQFDANLSEKQRQYNQDIAVDYVTGILKNGNIPSNELLVAAGLSYDDAQALVTQARRSGGGGGNKQTNGEENTFDWRPAAITSGITGANSWALELQRRNNRT